MGYLYMQCSHNFTRGVKPEVGVFITNHTFNTHNLKKLMEKSLGTRQGKINLTFIMSLFFVLKYWIYKCPAHFEISFELLSDHFFVLKMSPAFYICCIYSNAPDFFMEANNMGLDVRKPVFGVSEKERLKPVTSARERLARMVKFCSKQVKI